MVVDLGAETSLRPACVLNAWVRVVRPSNSVASGELDTGQHEAGRRVQGVVLWCDAKLMPRFCS